MSSKSSSTSYGTGVLEICSRVRWILPSDTNFGTSTNCSTISVTGTERNLFRGTLKDSVWLEIMGTSMSCSTTCGMETSTTCSHILRNTFLRDNFDDNGKFSTTCAIGKPNKVDKVGFHGENLRQKEHLAPCVWTVLPLMGTGEKGLAQREYDDVFVVVVGSGCRGVLKKQHEIACNNTKLHATTRYCMQRALVAMHTTTGHQKCFARGDNGKCNNEKLHGNGYLLHQRVSTHVCASTLVAAQAGTKELEGGSWEETSSFSQVKLQLEQQRLTVTQHGSSPRVSWSVFRAKHALAFLLCCVCKHTLLRSLLDMQQHCHWSVCWHQDKSQHHG